MPVDARPPLHARPARAGAAVHSRWGVSLLVFLIAACAYAAFAAGAVRLPDEARLQVLLALVAVAAAGIWVAGPVAVGAPPAAGWGAGLLAAFGLWCALGLRWGRTPGPPWQEANPALGSAPLPSLLVLGAVALAALPVLGAAFASAALTTNGAPLAQRIHDGRALGGVLLAALALLVLAGWAAMRLEPRALARWSPRA